MRFGFQIFFGDGPAFFVIGRTFFGQGDACAFAVQQTVADMVLKVSNLFADGRRGLSA